MSSIDWIVLSLTLLTIVAVGIWKSYGQKDLDGYFLGNKSLPWWQVMFSVMATQASAITFLSGPGQAFTDGMRFVQIYFGMPIAIIVVCAFFAPVYHKLNVYTAYEYLERRFDSRVRSFTAFLFLVQRGLAAGLTIYAPSLVLSSLLGWNIYITNSAMGILVISYTLSGGAKAVAYTQLQQMMVILLGMLFSAYIIVKLMPEGVGIGEALSIAGKTEKLNAFVTEFKWSDKYNIWSGLIGGFFLALSYFGTDQSQVGRYLAGKSSAQATKGLLVSAIVKIPMQFGILLIGSLLYVFYIFHPQPLVFNQSLTDKVMQSEASAEYAVLQEDFKQIEERHKVAAAEYLSTNDEILKEKAVLQMVELDEEKKSLRVVSKNLIKT